jgi:hypothetical protein
MKIARNQRRKCPESVTTGEESGSGYMERSEQSGVGVDLRLGLHNPPGSQVLVTYEALYIVPLSLTRKWHVP